MVATTMDENWAIPIGTPDFTADHEHLGSVVDGDTYELIVERRIFIVQIEHAVPSYDGWKDAFDRDPVNRAQAGVRRYRILRPIEHRNHVMVELEFDTVEEAERFLTAIRAVWSRVQGTIIENPQGRIVEVVESATL